MASLIQHDLYIDFMGAAQLLPIFVKLISLPSLFRHHNTNLSPRDGIERKIAKPEHVKQRFEK